MITKEEIVKNAAAILYANEGKLSYIGLSELFTTENYIKCLKDNRHYLNSLSILYAMAVITYKIPYYKDGIKHYRPLSEAFQDALTFYNSHKAEVDIIIKSTESLVDLTTGKVLPELKYADNTHGFLESGTGGSIPDLVDYEGIKYEVKRNYLTAGSRSSLHTANYLLNCSNHVVELYDLSISNWELQIPARFRNVLSPKVVGVPEWVREEDRAQLISGELIEEIASKVEELGFCWKL